MGPLFQKYQSKVSAKTEGENTALGIFTQERNDNTSGKIKRIEISKKIMPKIQYERELKNRSK